MWICYWSLLVTSEIALAVSTPFMVCSATMDPSYFELLSYPGLPLVGHHAYLIPLEIQSRVHFFSIAFWMRPSSFIFMMTLSRIRLSLTSPKSQYAALYCSLAVNEPIVSSAWFAY